MNNKFLPYGKQSIDENDYAAVLEALQSEWLTTGPLVESFESQLKSSCQADHAIVVNSGTAALHTAVHTLSLPKEAEVIVPALSFVATANCVVYEGLTPIFADVKPETLILNPASVLERITDKTRAIITMDYAGHPSYFQELREICDKHNLFLIDDACHAIGAKYSGQDLVSLADIVTYSFHPVKHITTGEGGALLTNNSELANKARRFRNHGISSDHRQRSLTGAHSYEMIDLGYNYRLTDFQCALGISQLAKLQSFLQKRRKIALSYDQAFAESKLFKPLICETNIEHAYHIYVVKVNADDAGETRDRIFNLLREMGIGVNVHYPVIYSHPYYRRRYGDRSGLCPEAERAYTKILSLPIFPEMSESDVERVIACCLSIEKEY